MTQPPSDPELFSLAQIQHLMRVEFGRAQRYEYPMGCLLVQVDRLAQLREIELKLRNQQIGKCVCLILIFDLRFFVSE